MVLSRVALSQFLLSHPQPGYAMRLGTPPQLGGPAARQFEGGPRYNQGFVRVRTERGGQAVEVAAPDSSHFRISIQLADSKYDGGLAAQTGGSGNAIIPDALVQPIGTIRAYPMPGGKVGLIVDGTTENMQVVIERLAFPQLKGYAHSFAYGASGRSSVLNVGSLNVTSGRIDAILGYHTANLSGPLTVGGEVDVDRIAFNSLLPGAAIGVGGTLDTLDVLNDANLTTGPGISVGQDLNLFNVGNDLILANGASLRIGRFAGLTPQPPKGSAYGSNFLSINQAQIGTGTAVGVPSLSANVRGDMFVGPGSAVVIGTGIANSSIVGSATNVTAPTVFLVAGSLNGESAAQFQIPNVSAGDALINAAGTGLNNLVALTGVNVPGLEATP
ncbi:MAG: hypothetical protein AB7I30_09825 [Isosphaeraceae bacterium]